MVLHLAQVSDAGSPQTLQVFIEFSKICCDEKSAKQRRNPFQLSTSRFANFPLPRGTAGDGAGRRLIVRRATGPGYRRAGRNYPADEPDGGDAKLLGQHDNTS